MKKIIVLLFLLLTLTSCGGVHENISKEMAKDTEQIISIFEAVIEEEREFTEREEATLQSYQVNYETIQENPDMYDGGLTEEENRLMILTVKMIEFKNQMTLLASDKKSFESNRDTIRRVIKTGEIYE